MIKSEKKDLSSGNAFWDGSSQFFYRLLLTQGARLKYNRKGFFLRYAFDIIISNIGLLLGYLVTITYYSLISDDFTAESANVLIGYWVETVPIFTFICLFSYFFSGLYSLSGIDSLTRRAFIVIRAVTFSFLTFIFFAYFFVKFESPDFMLPRSSIIAGAVITALLLLGARIGSLFFSRKFVLLPRSENRNISLKTAENLDVVAEETGWVPAIKTALSKGKAHSVSARFALWPYFENDSINSVVNILRSGKVNRWTGEEGALFEQEFAKFCNCKHAISLANGTVALELALRALNIGPGDEVIVPCRTFIASASCVVACGATPVVVDIDLNSQNLTTQTIKGAITERTKAIIAVHLAGWPCDMEPIMSLAREHDIKVVEDCAQAHGAIYKGKPVGSLGDVAAFSFCQDKIMTTGGEGGLLATNDIEVWKRAWSFKDHGKGYDAVYNQDHPAGYRWIHEDFGTNMRMTEIQCAIGRTVLKKVPFWVQTRQRYAHMLNMAFSEIPALRVTIPPDYIEHSYYKYYVFVRPEKLKKDWNRDRIIKEITDEGIPCYSGICGQLHKEKAFKKKGFVPSRELPVSQELMNTSLMFLVHPTLLKRNIEDTISVVQKVMEKATR